MNVAKHEIVHEECTEDILVIRDVSEKYGGISVTNSAEAVIDYCSKLGLLQDGRRCLYYDTMGRLDELLHDGNGSFTGFKALAHS